MSNVTVDQLRRRMFVGGVIILALSCVGGIFNPARFFQSYLFAFMPWIGISLGSLSLLMLHHLVSGRWGFVIQRLLEAAVRTLPLMAILFVPILFGMSHLYVWARPDAVAADEVLRHKQAYLNAPAFFARAVVYFLVWIGGGTLLTMLSSRQDQGSGTTALAVMMKRISGPGLVLHGFVVTLAVIDWVMSLEPQWYSSIYGIVFIVGQALGALAFVVIVARYAGTGEPLRAVLGPQQFHDLGNLLLAFVMLWAYIAVSQFLIIWAGNLPEEISWYLNRLRGGWQGLALFLVIFHFAVPFLILLTRSVKRRVHVLVFVAAGLLAMRFIDLFWLIQPAFHPGRLSVHWLDVTLPVGLGGLWLATYLFNLKRQPLLALHDPRFAAATVDAPHGG